LVASKTKFDPDKLREERPGRDRASTLSAPVTANLLVSQTNPGPGWAGMIEAKAPG
jgi:hypothetical protein